MIIENTLFFRYYEMLLMITPEISVCLYFVLNVNIEFVI